MGFIDNFIGRNDDADDEYEEEVGAWEKERPRDYERPKSNLYDNNNRAFGQNVIDFQDAASARDSVMAAYHVKVVVVEPKSFDDSQEVANCLREKRPVIINIENTDPEIAKRIIDFASGTCYALNGEIKKVGKTVFLCAPNNVNVSLPEDNKKSSMSWLNK